MNALDHSTPETEANSGQRPASAPYPKQGDAVEIVNPCQRCDWDQFVLDHPEASFFHGSAWPRVISESYGHRPTYFVIRAGRALAGLLPVLEVPSRFTGRRGVSLSFTDLCPPLCSDRLQFQRLLQSAIDYGKRQQWKYLECRGGFQWTDGVSPSATFMAHTLDLTLGEERLLKGLEGRVRNAVRKAEASGVKVEITHRLEDLSAFYHMHCRTRQRHGVPPQPFSFFESIHRNILAGGNGCVALAKLDSHPIAGAVFFHLGTRVIYKFSASELFAQKVRPNNLLMWEVIRSYAHSGMKEMHFGRTSVTNEGLRLYKRGFGTHEHELRYFRFDFRSGQFLSGSEAPPDWKNHFCSRLPVPFLRFAGRLLYRHMS